MPFTKLFAMINEIQTNPKLQELKYDDLVQEADAAEQRQKMQPEMSDTMSKQTFGSGRTGTVSKTSEVDSSSQKDDRNRTTSNP
jgi:hypothetical protein